MELLFTDQNSNPLEIEDKINITLVINESITYEKWYSISKKKDKFDQEIEYLKKVMDFSLLLKIWIEI